MDNRKNEIENATRGEEGRIGYLILWLMGAPISLLVVLWLVLGNNIFGAG